MALVASVAWGKEPKRSTKHDAKGSILLNGERVEVRWTDGDSFKFLEGTYKGKGTRLVGYNALEAFGPVHQWADWTEQGLYELALGASQVAASQEWACTTDGKLDGYQRLLVRCPQLAVEMAKQGVGLAYAVDGEKPAAEVLAAQKDAIAQKRGMWAKGVVAGVITSVHSVGEDDPNDQGPAYNRVVDTRTGMALKREHHDRYESCQRVCLQTDGSESCMIYVPFEHRYRNKAECLRK